MAVLLRLLTLCCGLTLGAAESLSAQVVIDETKPGGEIPADFLGISYEKNALVEPHFRPANTVLINLHRNLGRGTLRLGGNKVELTRWQADAPAALDKATGLASIGRATLDDLYGFLKATDWKCLHGLNLAGNQPEASADEAEGPEELPSAVVDGLRGDGTVGQVPWGTHDHMGHGWEDGVPGRFCTSLSGPIGPARSPVTRVCQRRGRLRGARPIMPGTRPWIRRWPRGPR